MVVLAVRVVFVLVVVVETLVRRKRETTVTREDRGPIEEGLAVLLDHTLQLCRDAPDGPDVDGPTVLLLQQNHFRSSVPPSHHVSSQLSLQFAFHAIRPLFLLFRVVLRHLSIDEFVVYFEALDTLGTPGEAEVTDLDGTVVVDEDIGWL